MVWADARFLCKEETSLDDNRAMRAESGVGTLPNGCCAPLAFPYVPVQKNDPERYSQQDALKAGTLFPGLNLPFHAQMKTKFPAVNTALSELMALDFAIDELGLYLTTHPEDTEVLNLYWSYIKLGREVREHNNFARRVPILEEQMKVANHRIADLENHERMKERN